MPPRDLRLQRHQTAPEIVWPIARRDDDRDRHLVGQRDRLLNRELPGQRPLHQGVRQVRGDRIAKACHGNRPTRVSDIDAADERASVEHEDPRARIFGDVRNRAKPLLQFDRADCERPASPNPHGMAPVGAPGAPNVRKTSAAWRRDFW